MRPWTKASPACRGLSLLVLILSMAVIQGSQAQPPSVSAATFDADDRLQRPSNMDEWIFLGTSLGRGYAEEAFDADSPGTFQVALMEPNAYRAFLEEGSFVDGTMFALAFYRSSNEASLDVSGFVMGEALQMEIHMKDSSRFPDGFNFYMFPMGVEYAQPVPLPNDCVTCHSEHGAFEAVFRRLGHAEGIEVEVGTIV